MDSRIKYIILFLFIASSAFAQRTILRGDMEYYDTVVSKRIERLHIGTTGQILTVASNGLPAWMNASGGGGVPAFPHDSTFFLRGDSTWASLNSEWSTTGNSGLGSSNFLGTNDSADIFLKVWGSQIARFNANNNSISFNRSTNNIDGGHEDFVAGHNNILPEFGHNNAIFGDQNDFGVDGQSYNCFITGENCNAGSLNNPFAFAGGQGASVYGYASIGYGSNIAINAGFSAAFGRKHVLDSLSFAVGENLKMAKYSFGFNTTNFTQGGNEYIDLTGLNHIAYFGGCDLIIGSDNTTIRALKFFPLHGQSSANITSTKYVGFQAPSLPDSNVIYTLPAHDGAAGQVLQTDGAGHLSWVNHYWTPFKEKQYFSDEVYREILI